MNLIVRDEKPMKIEDYLTRTARVIVEQDMNGWTDEQVEQTANGQSGPNQEAAHLIMRQRRNAKTTPTYDRKNDGTDNEAWY